MLNLIACIDQEGALGYEGKLLYHLPEDMKRFRQITMGHTIVMGYSTWLSLPDRYLPGRTNAVLTHRNIDDPRIKVLRDVSQVWLKSLYEDVYVIGGGKVYEQCIHFADSLILTVVNDRAPQADTWFPEITDRWVLSSTVNCHADERHAHDYSFMTFTRNNGND